MKSCLHLYGTVSQESANGVPRSCIISHENTDDCMVKASPSSCVQVSSSFREFIQVLETLQMVDGVRLTIDTDSIIYYMVLYYVPTNIGLNDVASYQPERHDILLLPVQY